VPSQLQNTDEAIKASNEVLDSFLNELTQIKKESIDANLQTLYTRPGPIENKHLLTKGNCLKLVPNLIEHHDFEAVCPEVWRHLYAWYGADWSI
jgi:hypothetical protein